MLTSFLHNRGTWGRQLKSSQHVQNELEVCNNLSSTAHQSLTGRPSEHLPCFKLKAQEHPSRKLRQHSRSRCPRRPTSDPGTTSEVKKCCWGIRGRDASDVRRHAQSVPSKAISKTLKVSSTRSEQTLLGWLRFGEVSSCVVHT